MGWAAFVSELGPNAVRFRPAAKSLAVSVAVLAMAGLTACGSSNTAACADVSAEITKLTSEYSAGAANMADAKAFDAANTKMSDGLKALAGKYDGDLASAVGDLADIYASFKIDDPAKMTALLAEIGTKQQAVTEKITKACA